MYRQSKEESLTDKSVGSSSRDKYTFFYTLYTWLLFLIISIYDVLDRIFHLWLLILPIIFVPMLIWFIITLVGFCWNIYKRRWCRLVSMIAAPIIIGLFFIILGCLGITANRMYLEYYKTGYLKEVAEIQANGGYPCLKTWDWGATGGIVTVNTFYVLVYDDTDQIALTPQSRSAEWQQKVAENKNNWILKDKGISTSTAHLDGHFYLVENVFP
jgi:hypothetical protein